MSLKDTVVVVDDDELVRVGFCEVIEDEGYRAIPLASGEGLDELLCKNDVSLVLVDLRMAGMTGLDILRDIKEKHPRTVVVIVTAYASLESAVDALRQGAYDYLLKPCSNADLISTVRRALYARRAGAAEMEELRLQSIREVSAMLNHEFERPLSGIRLYSDLLLERSRKEMDDDLRTIAETLLHCSALIEDVLRKLSSIVKPVVATPVTGERKPMLDIRASRSNDNLLH